MTDLTEARRSRNHTRRLAWRMRLARAALLWERVWPSAWPALCVLGIFAVLVLFDLLPLLPGLAHAGLLALLAVAFLAAIGWGLYRRTGSPVCDGRMKSGALSPAWMPRAMLLLPLCWPAVPVLLRFPGGGAQTTVRVTGMLPRVALE